MTTAMPALYAYGNTVTPPPNLGQLRANVASLPTVTHLYVSVQTVDNIDVYAMWMGRVPGDTLRLQDKTDHTQYLDYQVVSVPVEQAGYLDIEVKALVGGPVTTWPNGKQLAVFVQAAAAGGGGGGGGATPVADLASSVASIAGLVTASLIGPMSLAELSRTMSQPEWANRLEAVSSASVQMARAVVAEVAKTAVGQLPAKE